MNKNNSDSSSESDESEKENQDSTTKPIINRKMERIREREVKMQVLIMEHYIKEQEEYEMELEKDKLVRPCKCKSYCDYTSILSNLVRGFNKLYSKYEELYTDYYIVYTHNLILDTKTTCKLPKSLMKNVYVEKNSNSNNRVWSFMSDFVSKYIIRNKLFTNNASSSCMQFDDEMLNYFNYYAEIYEEQFIDNLDIEIDMDELEDTAYKKMLAKIQVLKRSQLFVVRWARSLCEFILGRKKCVCLHCTDRQNLETYRRAIYELYKEYRNVYLDLLALVYAEKIASIQDGHKLVVVPEEFLSIRSNVMTKLDMFIDETI